MKATLIWSHEGAGQPEEVQEMSLFWFNVLSFADVLTAVPVLRRAGYWLWLKAFDHAVTVWERGE